MKINLNLIAPLVFVMLFFFRLANAESFERKISVNNIAGRPLCKLFERIFSEVNHSSEILNYSVNCNVDEGWWTDDVYVRVKSPREKSACYRNERYYKLVPINDITNVGGFFPNELFTFLRESEFGLKLIHMDTSYAIIGIPRCLETTE